MKITDTSDLKMKKKKVLNHAGIWQFFALIEV